MVAQVGGEEGVDAGGAYLVEEAVAGAAADRDRADERVRVAGDADALRGGGQPLGGARGELARAVSGWSSSQTRPRPRRPVGVGRVRHERAVRPAGPSAPARASETPGSARVGVGVGDVQRDVVLDQGVHDAALEGGGRDRRRTAQIERVVGDQQVGAELHRLVGDLLDRVDGEQDAA